MKVKAIIRKKTGPKKRYIYLLYIKLKKYTKNINIFLYKIHLYNLII